MAETSLKVMLLKHTELPEETIALAGRLCYSGDHVDELYEKVRDNAESFVVRLAELGHESPIEHVSFTFGIEGVSRALLAQITRHRIASFSVQSQRYVKQDDFSYIVPESVKALGHEAEEKFKAQMDVISGFYNEWLEAGATPEDARFVLPNAAETRMILTMNARELKHFFRLRCCARAQWEIRELAWQMLRLAENAAPALFKYAGPACVSGPCSEGRMTCGNPESAKRRKGA